MIPAAARWPDHPVILEVAAWPWLRRLRAAAGRALTLADVPAQEWDRLVPAGVDAVWLMGVWQRSPAGRAVALADHALRASWDAALPGWTDDDVVGSPYCIREYQVDQWLGGRTALAVARRELAERGALLLVDFVPNHVAPDHPWTRQHPDAFMPADRTDLDRDPAGFVELGAPGPGVYARGRDPYFPPWPDVVQLNPFSPAYRSLATATLNDLADQADGVRCDMAMLALDDVVQQTWGDRAGAPADRPFWVEVLAAVRAAHPGFRFLAEAYWGREPDLLDQGFDACYDKTLYDQLVSGDVGGIRWSLGREAQAQARTVRFLENHDEPRAASTFGEPARGRAAAVVTAGAPGHTLWFDGQFEGRRVRLPVFLGREAPEPVDEELAAWYQKLLALARGLRAPGAECGACPTSGWPGDPTHERLVAQAWTAADDGTRAVVVVNYAPEESHGRVHLPWPDLGGRSWVLTDPLAEAVFERSGDELASEGLFVSLPGWGHHTLVVEAADDADAGRHVRLGRSNGSGRPGEPGGHANG